MACIGLRYATMAIFCAAACRVISARARSSMLTAKKSRQYRDGRLQLSIILRYYCTTQHSTTHLPDTTPVANIRAPAALTALRDV
jgi:hypothetical protein